MLRRVAVVGIGLMLLAGSILPLRAQTWVEPTAYTVVTVNSLVGPPGQWMKVYRSGSKAMIEQVAGDKVNDPSQPHSISVYDLAAGKNIGWSTSDLTACGVGHFSGDWGDPYAGAKDLTDGAKKTGSETVLGIAADIYTGSVPGAGDVKSWIDPKTGLPLKAQITAPGGRPQTIIQVLSVSLAPPPASVFNIPPACAAAFNAPPPPTEAEKIAALTGGNPLDFARVASVPGTNSACTVIFHVVKAGNLEPVTGNIQVAIDTPYDMNHPPSYTTGMGVVGKSTFAGGGIRQVAGQIGPAGIRLDDLGSYFYTDVEFGPAGGANAVVPKLCSGPQSTLLLVVKNPAKISDGADWLWVKSGKLAGH